jgi:hypothetical protein
MDRPMGSKEVAVAGGVWAPPNEVAERVASKPVEVWVPAEPAQTLCSEYQAKQVAGEEYTPIPLKDRSLR